MNLERGAQPIILAIADLRGEACLTTITARRALSEITCNSGRQAALAPCFRSTRSA